jgi:hypothetical protein
VPTRGVRRSSLSVDRRGARGGRRPHSTAPLTAVHRPFQRIRCGPFATHRQEVLGRLLWPHRRRPHPASRASSGRRSGCTRGCCGPEGRRMVSPAQVGLAGEGAVVRLHRGVRQPAAQALLAGLRQPRGVREDGSFGESVRNLSTESDQAQRGKIALLVSDQDVFNNSGT